MTRIIKVMLVDDHRRVHQAISEMLSFYDDIELIAQANNGRDAVELCEVYQPDLVLMDVVMPIMDGVEATKHIIQKQPAMKILALSSFREHNAVRDMLESGAIGYVLKDSSVDELEDTIRIAHAGQSVLSPEVMQTLFEVPQSNLAGTLSPREKEILTHFANGKTNGEIAATLNISISTVKFHISNIICKLGVQTRAEALVTAAKHNLV